MSNPPTINVDKTNRNPANDAKPGQQQQGQADKVQQQGGPTAAPTPADPPPTAGKQ